MKLPLEICVRAFCCYKNKMSKFSRNLDLSRPIFLYKVNNIVNSYHNTATVAVARAMQSHCTDGKLSQYFKITTIRY